MVWGGESLLLRVLERIWWVRWACVGSEGRIGWAAKVGVFKSADVCIVDFAVSRKGERVFISENVMDHSCGEVYCRREVD